MTHCALPEPREPFNCHWACMHSAQHIISPVVGLLWGRSHRVTADLSVPVCMASHPALMQTSVGPGLSNTAVPFFCMAHQPQPMSHQPALMQATLGPSHSRTAVPPVLLAQEHEEERQICGYCYYELLRSQCSCAARMAASDADSLAAFTHTGDPLHPFPPSKPPLPLFFPPCQEIATACLHLAAKVQEAPKPIREVALQCQKVLRQREPEMMELLNCGAVRGDGRGIEGYEQSRGERSLPSLLSSLQYFFCTGSTRSQGLPDNTSPPTPPLLRIARKP